MPGSSFLEVVKEVASRLLWSTWKCIKLPGSRRSLGPLSVEKLEAALLLDAEIMWHHSMHCNVSWSNYPAFRFIGHRMDQKRLWLGLSLVMVPEDTLLSEKNVLRALQGVFENNMKKYGE